MESRLFTIAQMTNRMRLFCSKTIDELGRSQNFLHKDFAVLYRTNAQSRTIEEALLKSNIPYTMVGGTKFYSRKEIRDIIAYLNLISNLNVTISVLSALSTSLSAESGQVLLRKFATLLTYKRCPCWMLQPISCCLASKEKQPSLYGILPI